MDNFNKFLGFLFFLFPYTIPLSIGQEIRDTAAVPLSLINPSFEQIDAKEEPFRWSSCNFSQETPPDLQPGLFGCTLLAQQGKHYMGMVARDNNTFESISQNIVKPLKAGVCYRLSVYLAKSSQYNSQSRATSVLVNYNRPLKLTIWGTDVNFGSKCTIKPEDWLAESLPIHNDAWRKYTFYIQPPKDVYSLVFSANHVVEQPYNGNLLIDNISTIEPVNCTDLRLVSGGQKSAFLAIQQVSEIISENAPKMIFGKKKAKLPSDTEGGHNRSFDQLLAYFETSESYKLVIRVKSNKELSKQRITFLYSYIFKNSNLKAQRVEIKPYSPKDEAYFWTFENEEIAVSFDSM
jgi:hypothetical protein